MAEARAPTIRVMTWNIHGAVGGDGVRDVHRVIALVQRHAPDIVALQEVDSRRGSAGANPTFELLGAALGDHAAEARLITAPDGDYGHALISRWPMDRTVLHDVSLPGREPRAAIETTIATPFGELHVAAAHLGLSFKERRHQADLLARVAQSGSTPGLILGDFNDWIWRGSVQRALALSMPERTHHRTFPAHMPIVALDRIYCRPAKMLLRSWTDREARRASDHLPVIADLDPGAAY